MGVARTMAARRPRIAVILGDPAGVGPELAAKLLSDPQNLKLADITVIADRTELDLAISDAGGVHVPVAKLAGPETVRLLEDHSQPAEPFVRQRETQAGGARCVHQLRRGLRLWADGEIDAIVFAPLNKTSLKKAGMVEEDELRWFAKELHYDGTTSEINIAGPLWTARVTSHVGIEKVAAMVTQESTMKAIELLYRLRWESGIERPRLAVCALNPHNGENGSFGRQEIDAIAPAVREARINGIDVQGPFPCDTIFLKRQHFDGIVTMYHDQGQIALKLLSFEGGVTVQGGLPMIIATPAHGTAFDIVGKNVASVTSTQQAFNIAVAMASRRLSKEKSATSEGVEQDLITNGVVKTRPLVTTVEVPSCC
ncbi:Putative PdxA family protein [Septoria linicola]|uniref:PdxA family protein n=1 Tax=Septoria linicola TaxID=215465 RepID=A0A9Q9B184_9PEZI|nr:putative PdxA family protein [Septoria linicola]USW59064.1 Putative PdxA family protein [Septoria linicola]